AFSNVMIGFCFSMICFSCNSNKKTCEQQIKTHWVGTWGTAVQLTEPHNCPPEPGLTGNSIRQRVRVSIGGDTIRLKITNEFGNDTLKISAINIAPALDSSVIDTTKIQNVYFNGKSDVNLEVGQSIISDKIPFKITNRMDVAITIFYNQMPSNITGHPGSRTTSYILTGNELTNPNFANSVKTDHWYTIERIDVLAPETSSAIAIIGNSITDGRGSTTNKQNRWPDVFSERLLADSATSNLAVLNMGIGGNCVVRGGLGPTASTRFGRDVLNQPGVKYVIIFEGVNDIGGAFNTELTEKSLIEAYSNMIDTAHAQGLIVYGATVTPFKESFYFTPEKEQLRQNVNNWIRTCGKFDAVIDLETAICSKDDQFIMDENLHDNDHLHPNAEGHKTLGAFIDLNLFK
ncbi:MAG: SGNH/GDSL hydrolase family protein, partial [Bacteroidales bacterium]|nr:SGNH/GDSL hydrolase family protein [Bacteroidales bacterium]